ncbi:MAG: hypothetical protein J0M20_12340 [Burkholderiales bacterium]|nr:hypothetical protein [Burkholderiales bacterium]
MRIVRRTEIHGSILPSAMGAIDGIPPQYLHHEKHQLLHPKSAYGTSIRLLTAQWTRTLDDLSTLRIRYSTNQDDMFLMDVATSYSVLLHKLNEHFDACYAVLRSLSPTLESKPTLVHSRYLDRVKLIGWKQFREATRNYRESHIGMIVNALKHSQGELCPLYFHSQDEFRPGYFLRGLLPGGIRGPDPRLHRGGNTAISFSRDMLIHLWWIYRTSDLLVASVAAYLDATYKHKLTPHLTEIQEANWSSVVQRCASLSPEFFPDEWTLPYPRAIYRQMPEELSIEFPSNAGAHKMRGEVQVRTLTTVDGTYPKEKVPYMGRDAVEDNVSIQRRA